MKRIILTCIFICSSAFAQNDLYPREEVYGGGIGYSTMYMILDSLPGESILSDLGLPKGNIQSRPFVLYGGEGFAQMSGPWRLGGYAGMGTARTSNVFDVFLYVNRDDTLGYKEPALGAVGDSIHSQYNDDLSIEARMILMLGAITVEYVIPISRDLELTAGALMGLGRYSLSIDQHIGTPSWEDYSRNIYGYIGADDKLYVPILDANTTLDSAATTIHTDGLVPITVTGSMTELSGSFFNFQPYVAIKWQFLDRMGLRLSAGFNKGTIGAGQWKLNGHSPIADSPKSALQGFALRIMVYFGL